MADSKDDPGLISRFREGDSSAFDEIVSSYQDRIYNVCRYILGNVQNAEDAAQDTFIKAFRNSGNFEPRASLYTWLYRIAVNTCLDHKKRPFFESLFRSSAGGEEYMLEPVSEAPTPERLYESKQTGELLGKALGRLSPKLRAALILKEIEGLSYDEIAEVMEISVGTVKSRISRARDEIRGHMKFFTEQS